MQLTIADIRDLCDHAAEKRVRISVSAAGAVTIRPESERGPLSSAEKQRRYRERNKTVTGVTGKVTPEPETVTSVTVLPQNSAPPSPPPSLPLSPTPPLPRPSAPAPPPPLPATPTHEARAGDTAKPSRNRSGKALLRAEAEATSASATLPKDLDTPPFRAAWADWCEWREKLAGQGKPWSAIAAKNLLRQCADNGEAWAIAEIRQALSSGWQGVQWDQRRNPCDVRSQPMLPLGVKPAPPATATPSVNRWSEDHLAPTHRAP